jgi:hypoxanthine phosphoribosyltransferase
MNEKIDKKFLSGENEISKVLIPQDRLLKRVSELGEKISQDYEGKDLAVVAILKGSFVFAADLLRALTLNTTIDFMSISSYAGESRTGVVRITKDLEETITGRDVLLVEDIIDTGLTVNYLMRVLRERGPASIRLCALLDKSARRLIDLPIEYRGFDIPDVFVVGYGMDFQQKYRNLPYIAVLRKQSGESGTV